MISLDLESKYIVELSGFTWTENGDTTFIATGTHLYNKKNLTKLCTTEYHNK